MPHRDPPYRRIVLDCDSTLSEVEGIEELTSGRADVAELTALAMDGAVPLEEVYGRRLELVRPTRDDVDAVAQRYVETAVRNARETVAALRSLGKDVVIVSGGLAPCVAGFARWLGVDERAVHAVGIDFDGEGRYAGFDDGSPLARAGGKLDLVRELFPDGDVVLVGDGATDLEARPACARFVAFAGVERRDAVVAGADRVVDVADLAAILPHVLAPDELDGVRDAFPTLVSPTTP